MNITYELHFYDGEDAHHVITSNQSPQLTYGELRAGEGGETVASYDGHLWNVPHVGDFTDVVICAKTREIILSPEELFALEKHSEGCALTIERTWSDSDEGLHGVVAVAEGGSPPFRIAVTVSESSGESSTEKTLLDPEPSSREYAVTLEVTVAAADEGAAAERGWALAHKLDPEGDVVAAECIRVEP